MAWARLDDDFHDNGKILELSHAAFRLYVCAITYCRRHRIGGALTEAQIGALCRQQRVPRPVVAELVEARCWHPGDGGFRIHDFEQYQPKPDQTNAARQRRYRDRHASVQHALTAAGTSSINNGSVTALRNDPMPMPMPMPTLRTAAEGPAQEEREPATHAHDDAARRRARVVPVYSIDFEAWWTTYPRHDAKNKAAIAYARRRAAGRSTEALLAAARHYAQHAEVSGTPTEKIAHGATWLNDQRDQEWERGPPDAVRSPPPRAPDRRAGYGDAGFPDYRSAAEKAVEPVRRWRDLNVRPVGT